MVAPPLPKCMLTAARHLTHASSTALYLTMHPPVGCVRDAHMYCLQVHVYFKRFDEAEALYRQMDRLDLAINLRSRYISIPLGCRVRA